MTSEQTANARISAGFNISCHLMALLGAQARSTRQPDLMRQTHTLDTAGQLDFMTMKF